MASGKYRSSSVDSDRSHELEVCSGTLTDYPRSEKQEHVLRKERTGAAYGRPCHFSNITALEETVALKRDCSSKQRITSEAEQLVRAILETVEGNSSLVRASIHLRGSMKNNLKIGRPDEIDFLVELHLLSAKGCNGWALLRDSLNESVDRMECPDVGLEFCYQIQLPKGYQLMNIPTQCLRSGIGHQQYLDAKRAKDWFSSEMETAIQRILSRDLDSSPSAIKLQFTYDKEKGILLFLPKYTNFVVKIDVTPCVCFVVHKKDDLLLVPSSRHNTWRPSNDDPQELQFTIVSQAIRLIKALRDLSEKQSSSFTKVSYFVLQEKEGTVTTLPKESRLFTRHLATAFLKPNTTSVPSYAIVGSVVQHHRKIMKERGSPELMPDNTDSDSEDENFPAEVIENQMGEPRGSNYCASYAPQSSQRLPLVSDSNRRYAVRLTALVMDVLNDCNLSGPDGNALLAHKVETDWGHRVLDKCLSTAKKLNTPKYLERIMIRDLPLYYDSFTPDPLDYMRQSGPVTRFDTLPGWQVCEIRSDYFIQWFLEHCGRGLSEDSHTVLNNLSKKDKLYLATFQSEHETLYDVHHSFMVPFKRVLEAASVEECLEHVSRSITDTGVLKIHSLCL